MNDLQHGVEFKYSSSSCGVAPGLLRIKSPPSDFPSPDNPPLPPVSKRAVCLPPKTPGHICAGRSLDIVFYRGDATALPMYGRGDHIEGHIVLKNTKDICQIDITVRFLSGHLPGLVTAHWTAPTGIGSSLLLGTRSPANHPGSLKAFSTEPSPNVVFHASRPTSPCSCPPRRLSFLAMVACLATYTSSTSL